MKLGIKTSNLMLVQQMKPSSIPSGPKVNSFPAERFQNWHKNGECPEGTIPIRRTQEDEYPRATHLTPPRTRLNHSLYEDNNHEVSVYQMTDILHKQ